MFVHIDSIVVLLVCYLLVHVPITEASCSISPPIKERLMTGKIRHVCIYKGVRMDVGSDFETMDCNRCVCSENGLSCCGVGYRAGKIATFPGCEIIGDGCDPIAVKTCDNSKDCNTGLPINVKQ